MNSMLYEILIKIISTNVSGFQIVTNKKAMFIFFKDNSNL